MVPMEPDEDLTGKLLERWHAGDGGALDELLVRDLPWIRRCVHRRLGQGLRQRAETEDFVQEAVLEVLRYGPRFVVGTRAGGRRSAPGGGRRRRRRRYGSSSRPHPASR